MVRNAAVAIGLLLAALSNAQADATQRQVMEIKYNPLLAELGPEFKQMIVSQVPQDTVTRVKGDRAFTTSDGVSALIDYRKKQITLLHPGIRRYTVMTFADYVTLVRAVQIANPPSADDPKTVAGVKGALQTTKKTGNTKRFRGIEAEETLLTISMETPKDSTNPGGVRMEMQLWLPNAREMERFPALKELAANSARNEGVLDSWETMQHLLSQFPGLETPFRETLAELTRNSSVSPLSMRIRLYSPMLEQMAKIVQMAGQKFGPDVDPAGPLADITMDWSDISAEPLPDSLFEVPVGYRQASLSEFVQAINQQATPTPDANLPVITDSTLGNRDKSIPSVISSDDPEYTPEARKARIQGAVVLQATIGVDGMARNFKVVRSLDVGLDQKAIEAAGKWKFRPAQKDGAPAATDVQIEVRFRILER